MDQDQFTILCERLDNIVECLQTGAIQHQLKAISEKLDATNELLDELASAPPK